MLFSILAIDLIIDLGAGTFQAGTLRKQSQGNTIEALLNSQSKRFSPTLVAFDGNQFHVGEYAVAYQKKNPGPIFKNFASSPTVPITSFAADSTSPELADITKFPAVLLISALMNHITTNMIPKSPEPIDITLIHPASFSVNELKSFQKSIEQLPNCRLALTIPTPAAVVVSHLSNRMNLLKTPQQFVIVDIGAKTTSVSVLNSEKNATTQTSLVFNKDLKFGGEDLNDCILQQFVIPKIPSFDQSDLKLMVRANQGVEKAKIALSGLQSVTLQIDSITSKNDFHSILTRDELNQCAKQLWNDSSMQEFADAAFHLNDEKTFIFYGGSSRIPYLQKLFEEFFGSQILKTVNLDEGAIFGGGLIAAGNAVGFKVVNKFTIWDETRPSLELNGENLMKLNSNAKVGFSVELGDIEAVFSVENDSFSVNHVNETFHYETDESGERKKKASQLYNSDKIEYVKIQSKPEYFANLEFKATNEDEVPQYSYKCQFQAAKFDSQQILKKYESKKGNQNGMSGIKIQRLPEIKKEAEEYSEQVTQFVEILNNYKQNSNYSLKIVYNFSTDSASTPEMTYAAIQLLDREKMLQKVKNNSIVAIQEFPLDFKCKFVQNKEVDEEYVYKESYNLVWDSNEIQSKRKTFEDQINSIEDILINADEFLAKYPSSNESSGNFLLYREEADFLQVAIQDARYFMENLYLLPKCQTITCLDERLNDLSSVLKKVVDLQMDISKHILTSECRPDSESKFYVSLDKLKSELNNVDEFKNAEQFSKFNQSIDDCNLIKSLEIDQESVKKDKKKSKKAKKGENKTKLSEKDWFQSIFNHQKSKPDNQDIDVTNKTHTFYTKSMLKKLRKVNNDCGFLNGTYSKLTKKYDEGLKNIEKYTEFKDKFEAELSLRPVTECKSIQNKAKDISKEADDLIQSVKAMKQEIDRSRISNVLPNLVIQALEYEKQYDILQNLHQHLQAVDLEQSLLKLNELGIQTTNELIKSFKDSDIYAKLLLVENDQIDKVIDSMKEFFKSNSTHDEL